MTDLSSDRHPLEVLAAEFADRCRRGEAPPIAEYAQRHPDLAEASVVGRPHPEWGEEVVAFVVARAGTELSAADLDRLCLDNIARFKRPKDYKFVGMLPKNNYGKILKTELRKLL